MNDRSPEISAYDSARPPRQYAAIRLNPNDNVATAIAEIGPNARVSISDGHSGSFEMEVVDEIPFGHKFSVRAIKPDEDIVKYGETIGTARDLIPPGRHVHVHNVESHRGRGDVELVVSRSVPDHTNVSEGLSS